MPTAPTTVAPFGEQGQRPQHRNGGDQALDDRRHATGDGSLAEKEEGVPREEEQTATGDGHGAGAGRRQPGPPDGADQRPRRSGRPRTAPPATLRDRPRWQRARSPKRRHRRNKPTERSVDAGVAVWSQNCTDSVTHETAVKFYFSQRVWATAVSCNVLPCL
jgi:hypothetical protein